MEENDEQEDTVLFYRPNSNKPIYIYLISIYFVRRINKLRKINSIKKCHGVKWKGRLKRSPLHIEGL